MKIPERTKLPNRYQSPTSNDRVRVAKYPMISGPTKPPRFPTELMRPIDAAAAESLRNSVGTAQKGG